MGHGNWGCLPSLGRLLLVDVEFLFPVVSFDRMRTITVDIDRVEIISPMRSGRLVRISPKRRSDGDLLVREAANFLDQGVHRFSTLRSGDSVVAWLAPDGRWAGDRSNVWQLWRGTEHVLEYSEMVEATSRARVWVRLFGGSIATVGVMLGAVGTLGLNWRRPPGHHQAVLPQAWKQA
jgi:hypothetical protein